MRLPADYCDLGTEHAYLGHFRQDVIVNQGHNPAVSQAQQRFMGAELARLRAGKHTSTGMTENQLSEFAGTKLAGLPGHVRKG